MPQEVLDPRQIGVPAPPKSPPTTLPPVVRRFGYLPDFDAWRPGDLLLFSAVSPDRLQRRIVGTQEGLGYSADDARWHHAAVYIGDRHLCEARPGGVRYRPLVKAVDITSTLIRVRRAPSLSDDDRFRVAIRALTLLTRGYSYLAALRTWFRSWKANRTARGLLPRSRAIVCSQLFHDAHLAVTRTSLVPDEDDLVLPAELSASADLDDVSTPWASIPR